VVVVTLSGFVRLSLQCDECHIRIVVFGGCNSRINPYTYRCKHINHINKGESMTRTDYRMIAEAIKKHRNESLTAKGEFAELVETLSIAMKAQNPRFKREVFEKACGLEN
jgi:hypothetical protein